MENKRFFSRPNPTRLHYPKIGFAEGVGGGFAVGDGYQLIKAFLDQHLAE